MNRQFVALSGIAMLLIVLNHSIHFGLESTKAAGYALPGAWILFTLETLQALGNFAVPVFLFISGSFVAYAVTGETSRLSGKFLYSSLVHILVPYLIWSLIFYLLLFLLHSTSFIPLEYIKNLITGYPYHFIPLLGFFYLISPILVVLSKRYPWFLIGILLIYQLFLINIKYPGVLGFTYPDWANIFKIPVFWGTMADWLICFPLGVMINIHAKRTKPWLLRIKWPVLIFTVILFILGNLDAHGIISIFLPRLIAPLIFLLFIPVIQRNSIPWVRSFEQVGKRSYGLYLMHLIILDTLLVIIAFLAPGVVRYGVLTYTLLFAAGVLIPLWIMNQFAKSPARKYFRYIFG